MTGGRPGPRIVPPPMGWQGRGLCRENPGLFDDLDNFPSPDERRRIEVAMSVCARCPVRQECLAFGMKGKCWGVFGGFLLRGGKAVVIANLFDKKRRQRSITGKIRRAQQRAGMT